MAGKPKHSPRKYQKHAQKRAKRAVATVKKRVQDYNQGDKLVKKVSNTLKQIAKTHPTAAGKKQAKMALRQLNDAHAAFGSACLCQGGDIYNQTDG